MYNESMPYKDGVEPDNIINPHTIHNRMTIAQLMECLMKVCTNVGGMVALLHFKC